MIKVTLSTLEATREELPDNLLGLDEETLRNLQTELNPVPAELVGIEYWPEVVSIPDYDPLTQKLEGETLVADEAGKFVTATAIVVPYTPEVVYITSMSRTDFKGMFTPTEYRAISVEAETDDNVFQFWDMAQTADHVDLEDSRTMMGMAYLVSVGIFDQPRHDVIMLGKLQ